MDDFVQATGTMMRTKAGEISVRVSEFKLLSKSLSPLPVIKQKALDDGTVVEFGEFSDVETRYRQRYADLAVNRDVRDIFVKRAQVIRALRHFFDAAASSKSRRRSSSRSTAARRRVRSSRITTSCIRICSCASASSCTSSGCWSAATMASTRSGATSATKA